jgi:hypothetical protein
MATLASKSIKCDTCHKLKYRLRPFVLAPSTNFCFESRWSDLALSSKLHLPLKQKFTSICHTTYVLNWIYIYCLGKLHLLLLNFRSFCRHPSNVQKLSLRWCIKVWFFSHFAYSVQKILRNVNFTPDSKTIPFLKRCHFSFGVKDKIGIALGFSVQNEQSERKPKFHRVFAKVTKV